MKPKINPETEPITIQLLTDQLDVLLDQIAYRNEIIRELCVWLEEEIDVENWEPDAPGKKLWNKAHRCIDEKL